MNIQLASFAAHIFYVTVLIIHHSFTLSESSSGPTNTVSVLKNKVKMECSRNSSDRPINWEFASVGSNEFVYIYIAKRITEDMSSRYKIDTDNRTRYDVDIDSADLSHAGKYRCTPITKEFVHLSSYTAELVVLASDPVCKTNASVLNGEIVEGDYLRMLCTVNYSGNWIPVLEWNTSNGQNVDVNINYTSTSTTVTSALTVQLYSRDNVVTFTCKTSFKQTSTKISRTPRPGETLATNVPGYQHLWHFKANILYPPMHLIIKPVKRVFDVGDHLECLADGNPSPEYQWTAIETNTSINGSVLTIENHMMSNQIQSFRCTAFNTLAGLRKHIFETIVFTVRDKSQASKEYTLYIIIAMIIVGTVCCVIFISCLCKSRCPCRKGTTRHGPDILRAMQVNFRPNAESSEDQSLSLLSADGRQGVEGAESHSVDKGATDQSKHQGLPVYTEVVKNRNGLKNSEEPRRPVNAIATQYRSPKTLTGADGTQYMDVSSIRDLNARAPIRHPPMFSEVEAYASIDHTIDAPPPLPPKRQ